MLVCFSTDIKSQTSWFNFGISQSLSSSRRSFANFGTNINWKSETIYRNAGLSFSRPIFSTNDWISTFNYGIGYSYITRKIIISSISIGPSVSFGDTRNETDDKNKFFWAAGLTINAQLFISPLFFLMPEFAVGIEPYFNYNLFESRKTSMKHLYGVRFSININNND